MYMPLLLNKRGSTLQVSFDNLHAPVSNEYNSNPAMSMDNFYQFELGKGLNATSIKVRSNCYACFEDRGAKGRQLSKLLIYGVADIYI